MIILSDNYMTANLLNTHPCKLYIKAVYICKQITDQTIY